MNIIAAVTPEMDGKLWIGKDNSLLYHDKLDMEIFKKYTKNQVIVMGRATYDSIGHPLKDRLNIVITTDERLLKQTRFKNSGKFIGKRMKEICTYLDRLRVPSMRVTDESCEMHEPYELMWVEPNDLFKVLLFLHANTIGSFTTYLIGGTFTFETFLNLSVPVIDAIILDQFVDEPELIPNKEFPLTMSDLGKMVETRPIGLCGKFMTHYYESKQVLFLLETLLKEEVPDIRFDYWIDDISRALSQQNYAKAYGVLISVMTINTNLDDDALREIIRKLEIPIGVSNNRMLDRIRVIDKFSNTLYEKLSQELRKHFTDYIIW